MYNVMYELRTSSFTQTTSALVFNTAGLFAARVAGALEDCVARIVKRAACLL